MRLRRLTPASALGLALLLAVSPVAAAGPATGAWSAIGPAVPALFGPSRFSGMSGAQAGPDGLIYAYGVFQDAAGDPTADNLFVYDPVANTVVGLGSDGAGNGALNSSVDAIAWYGGLLYVGGSFTNAGGVAGASYLAAWNGHEWLSVGTVNGWVSSLAVGGGLLYAGGLFFNAGGTTGATFIAAYDGYTWSKDGSGAGPGGSPLNERVYSLAALPDGRLYAAGMFSDAGGNPDADLAAWWDPASESWEKIGTAAGSPFLSGTAYAIAVSGNRIVVGGCFVDVNSDTLADYVAEWNGSAWVHYGTNGAGGASLNDCVYSLLFYGTNVVVGGGFANAGGLATADRIANWNGTSWVPLGNAAMTLPVYGLARQGRTLYAAGSMKDVAGIAAADGIAAFGLPAPPSSPRSPAGVAGLHKVSLAWSAPLTGNGASVRDYVIQYRKTGTLAWRTFNDGVSVRRTASVTGLHSGWSYQFRVLAKNDWGMGAASAIVKKVSR